jgi:hypothetical protein
MNTLCQLYDNYSEHPILDTGLHGHYCGL